MNHFTLFLITLTYLARNVTHLSLNKECCFSTKSYRHDRWVTLTDFDRFGQLNFNCNQPINISSLELKPTSNNLILDDSLQFNNLSIRVDETIVKFSILLNHFHGFDLKSNPFRDLNLINFKSRYIYWIIRDSYFQFFDKNIPVNDICDHFMMSEKTESLIENFHILLLTESVKFLTNTCPIIFNNTHIEFISIYKISTTLIHNNFLEFQTMNANVSQYFQSSIFQFLVTLYHYDLNSKFLNQDIFRKLYVLDLNGIINKIQGDVFKSLKRLKMLRLRSQKVKKLFMENNKWLEYLNYDVKINLADREDYAANLDKILILVIFQTFPIYEFYDYKEEDFCYFRNFPHDRMVLPELFPNDKSSCSCTEIFLIQYSVVFSKLIDMYKRNAFTLYNYIHYYNDEIKTDNYLKCVNSSYNLIRIQCDFAEKIEKCKIKTTYNEQNEGFNFYVYDWAELSGITRYIFTIYVNLILSTIGIFVNGLIILILSNRNLTNDKMYLYLKINAFFNLLHILCLLVKLVFKDFNYTDFIDNWSIKSQSNENYYSRLIFVKLIGNTVKTSSNIAHLSFTLSRFITITSNKMKFLTKFNKLNLKMYFLITLCVSLALNLHLYFEFEIQQKTILKTGINLKNFSSYYKIDASDEYKENFSDSEYLSLSIFQYIRIIFSDLFYLLLTTIFDLFLFNFVKRKMNKKKELLYNRVTVTALLVINPLTNHLTTHNNNNNNNNNNSNSNNNSESSQKRISQMILFNGLNFIFLRFPFSMISFYGFMYRYDNTTKEYKPDLVSYIICKRFRFCLTLEEVFYSIYLISYLVHFLIFLKLDKNFRESFKIIRQKCTEKMRGIFS